MHIHYSILNIKLLGQQTEIHPSVLYTAELPDLSKSAPGSCNQINWP